MSEVGQSPNTLGSDSKNDLLDHWNESRARKKERITIFFSPCRIMEACCTIYYVALVRWVDVGDVNILRKASLNA